MEAVLDMNSQRIINLPAAVDANDAVRKSDFDEYQDAAEVALAAAELAQADAEAAVVAAETARDNALTAEAAAATWAALAAAATGLLNYTTVANLVADTIMSYTPGPGLLTVASGNIVQAGGYRYQVVTTGEHLTTAGGVKLIVLPVEGKYPAAAFNIAPGSVNVTTFKAAVAVATAAGAPLVFGPGTFSFGGSNILGTSLSPGGSIGAVNIEGTPGTLLAGGLTTSGATVFDNIGTSHFTSSVRFIGVTFTNSIGPIYSTGGLDSFEVTNCRFINCRRSFYHNDDAVGTYVKNGRYLNNYHKNNVTYADFLGGLLLHKPRLILDVDIQKNYFEDLKADSTTTNIVYCIAVGNSNYTTDDNRRVRANQNTIIGCGNDVVATPTTSSFGVVVLANDSEQNGNVVRNGGWINACYMKGHQNKQNYNVVSDPEWGGVSMKVTASGDSRDNSQSFNIVTGVVDREGAFRMFGDGITIGNQATTTSTAELHPTEGGYAYFITQSTTQGPMYIQGQFNCPRGIKITCGGDVTVDAHLVSAADGVEVYKQTTGNVGHVKITGKIDCAGLVATLNPGRSCEIYDLEFSTNYSGTSNSAFFMYTEEGVRFSNVRGIITDTLADGVSLGYVISSYAKESGARALTNHSTRIKGLDVTTFRNLTHFSRSFADASLSGKTRISLSDVGIDLQTKTCGSVHKVLTNTLLLSLDNVRMIGTPTRTIDGSGITITDLDIQGGVLNYVTAETLAGHTNATATRHRINDNTNMLPFSVTVDFGSLALNASSAIATTTVTGAVLGNRVTDLAFSINTAGIRITAWVSAANTVSYYATNENGTNPLDLASGTLTGVVRR